MTNAEQIKTVENLRGAALREKYREVTGFESRSNNRPYLLKRIIQALQARALEKPVATAAPAQMKNVAPTKAVPSSSGTKAKRDPRLPAPGTILEREHDGKTIRVKVLEAGFEFRGKTYRSLSGIAREVTSTPWNGLLFFHLIPYAKRTKKAA